jgi:phenylacetate-CoA ligase
MVFQYNPLETFLETTAESEILCTINSMAVLNPKVRYNIGDEGRLATFPEVMAAISDEGARGEAQAAFAVDRMRLPLLFLYGRKDSTISYMGANIYPQDVEYGLYHDNPHAHLLQTFCLELEEHSDLECRPIVNLQLREDAALDAGERKTLADTCRDGVLAHLVEVSRDFAASMAEDPSAADLRVKVYDFGTGPFAGTSSKIKNTYLVKEAAA